MSEALYPFAPVLLVDDETAWLRGMSLALARALGVNNHLQCADSREVLDLLARRLLLQPQELRHEVFQSFDTISPRMEAIFRYVDAISVSSEPVLITGESGTGKELIARAIHQLSRPNGPLVAVNAAGLDDQRRCRGTHRRSTQVQRRESIPRRPHAGHLPCGPVQTFEEFARPLFCCG